jgi:transitional endoplasmic reticulum ATPase
MDPSTQAAECLERGLEEQAAGQLDAARLNFLQAADHLFRAARDARGALKAQRTAQAERLLEQAEALALQLCMPPSTRRGAGGSGKVEPLSVGDEKVAQWLVAERPDVRFDDVAGLEDVKEQIRLKLIYPFTHPEQAQRFGIRPGGGILLYGPPGTGKTLLARAIAGEVDAAFFSIKPSEIMSKWVGEAEQNVEKLFAAAHSYPRAVIYIDEVESLLPRRRGNVSTVMQRVVPQFLAELQGFETKPGALLFIGATNEPWALDPAAMRPGRFDERVYVPLPDPAARRRILELNLRDRPLSPDVDLDVLTARLEGYSGADIANLCRKACAVPFLEAVRMGIERDVTLGDFEQVLAHLTPSVAPGEASKYAGFGQEV